MPPSALALETATDLAADLEEAQRQGAPLLIMIALDPCPFCHEVRTHYLEPMLRRVASGDAPKVVIREVRLDRDTPLLDFARKRTHHRAWARAQGAKVAPTLIAYSPSGARKGELVGAGMAGFYDAYLEKLLSDARSASR